MLWILLGLPIKNRGMIIKILGGIRGIMQFVLSGCSGWPFPGAVAGNQRLSATILPNYRAARSPPGELSGSYRVSNG